MGKKNGDPEHIRLLTDGLIDGLGVRWDRVPATEGHAQFDSVWRFLSSRGISNRTDVVEREVFLRLAGETTENQIEAFRASDGSGRMVLLVEGSDC